MIPTSSSDRILTADDYLLYRRCPRSLHWRLTSRSIPDASASDALFPVGSDRALVGELFRTLYPHGVDAAETPDGSSDDASVPVFGQTASYGPFSATADIWRSSKPRGMAAGIVREATSIKAAYLAECAFIRYCFSHGSTSPTRLLVWYINKSYLRDGKIDPMELLTEADVTRRVDRAYGDHERRIEELASIIAEDPDLTRFADTQCAHPHSCSVCSTLLDAVDDSHVSTLYRGGQLVRDLLGEGVTSILEIPAARLVHPRQRIQKRSLERRRPHVDRDALLSFLETLKYPLFYLDFEAVSMAIPQFDRVRPWEHVPYLYSLHREDEPGFEVSHMSFMMEPGVDQRRDMAMALLESLGEGGSIVVYNASFESGILARLGMSLPDLAPELASAQGRIVDLLEPFNEFTYYDHRQRGKVSLKTVLPILTEYDYDDESIHDGYTANLAYRSLSEGRSESRRMETLDGLVAYCAMDTLAMVEIVRTLRSIVELDDSST